MGEVMDATEASINAAVASGILDRSVSAGPIAALRRVAELLDDPDFPLVGGRLDNVSLPTYLRYCAELRLTPGAPVKSSATSRSGGDKGGEGGGTLGRLRGITGGKSA